MDNARPRLLTSLLWSQETCPPHSDNHHGVLRDSTRRASGWKSLLRLFLPTILRADENRSVGSACTVMTRFLPAVCDGRNMEETVGTGLLHAELKVPTRV